MKPRRPDRRCSYYALEELESPPPKKNDGSGRRKKCSKGKTDWERAAE